MWPSSATGPAAADTLQQTRRRARLALGVPAGATVVGAVGRLTCQKAPEDFVPALAELGRRDVIAVWIGGGELAERVASMAKSTPWVRLILAGDRVDVVIPGETGLLVPPAQPRLLAKALRYLLDSPLAAARMATAARARLGTPFTEAALCDALRAGYATGTAPIAVSSANWPSPTLG